MGNVRMVAAISLKFVEHAQKDPKDEVAARSMVRFAVDVEQHHVGIGGNGALDVREQDRVLDLTLEELDGLGTTTLVRVGSVAEQVRNHL